MFAWQPFTKKTFSVSCCLCCTFLPWCKLPAPIRNVMHYRLKEYRYDVFDSAGCDCVTLGLLLYLPHLTQRGLLEESMWLQVGSVTGNRWWTRAAESLRCSHSLLWVHLCHQRIFYKSGSFLPFCYRKNLDGEGAKGSSDIKFLPLILFEKYNLSRWILQTCLFCLDEMELRVKEVQREEENEMKKEEYEEMGSERERKNDDEQISALHLF